MALPVEREEAPVIPDFIPTMNTEVKHFIKYFTEQRRGTFSKWLERYGRYGPTMRKILRENGLPEDLVFVAMVESGLSPHAYSRARATGPWQFMTSTGRNYGLTINWWMDERNDPVKSTQAAANYLKDLYNMLGSWPLALAGYNAGEYRVKKAMDKVGTTDFWRLYRTRYLKRETRKYVPQIMAAYIIAKNPRKYGFTDIKYESPLLYDEVVIDEPTDIGSIAHSVGVNYEDIKTLNPELKRGVTPPNHPHYKIKIPYGSTPAFLANFKKNQTRTRFSWQRHRVHRGETLSRIASRYGTSVNAIMHLNKLNNPHRIRIGDDLLIPTSSHGATRGALVSASGGSYAGGGNTQTLSFRISPGDTLSDIAREFKVSIEDILSLNNLRNPHRIYAGKEILIPASGTSALALVRAASVDGNKRENGKAEGELLSHRVARGETLSEIALRYGTDTKRIVKLNGFTNVNKLRAGQVINIPLAASDGAASSVLDAGGASSRGIITYKGNKYRKMFHTVRKGNTLWEIARSYDVDLKDLKRWNGLIGRQHIYPGDVLEILIALR